MNWALQAKLSVIERDISRLCFSFFFVPTLTTYKRQMKKLMTNPPVAGIKMLTFSWSSYRIQHYPKCKSMFCFVELSLPSKTHHFSNHKWVSIASKLKLRELCCFLGVFFKIMRHIKHSMYLHSSLINQNAEGTLLHALWQYSMFQTFWLDFEFSPGL